MNTFANRFSTSGIEAEIRKATAVSDNEELSDAMWGSEAGFGSLVNGHSFNIPAVPDVRAISESSSYACTYACIAAKCIPQAAYRRPRGSELQDQDPARYHYARIPLPGRCYCCRRLSCYSRELHWCVFHRYLPQLRALTRRAASGTVRKVIEINPYLLGTMAGGAGTL
jgi:20S proteasome subunit beta 5